MIVHWFGQYYFGCFCFDLFGLLCSDSVFDVFCYFSLIHPQVPSHQYRIDLSILFLSNLHPKVIFSPAFEWLFWSCPHPQCIIPLAIINQQWKRDHTWETLICIVFKNIKPLPSEHLELIYQIHQQKLDR